MSAFYPKRLFSITLLACTCVWQLSGCSVNPATGSPDVVFTSESGELEMGKKVHATVLQSMPIYDDKKLNSYVNKVGQKIAAHSDRPDIPYQFFIIDSPEINAFAAPGGYVYINRGLIAFLHNEAQLAAVLAHEVAHITARHAIRQESASAGAKTLSILSAVLTRSNEVGQATGLYATAAVKGYGREMELEADGFGAEYLANAGYPASAMVDVIGILKDQETYAKRKARASGRTHNAYHGVFSSHPRNDKRLRELIAKAGDTQGETHVAAFRENVNGMVYGRNHSAATVGQVSSTKASSSPNSNTSASNKAPAQQRYRHKSLGFSFAYPDNWQVTPASRSIDSQRKDGSAKLTLLLEKHQNAKAESWLRQRFQVGLLRQSEPLYQQGLSGHTGIIQDPAKGQQRLAVLYKGSLAFAFSSDWHTAGDFSQADTEFMTIVRSFRPERRQRTASQSSNKTLHFVKANTKTRFATIARQAGLGRTGEEQLRLINGYYPRGEPRPGEVIKIIQ